MKVLVNAVSIKEGGPLVVLDQLVRHMAELRGDIQFAVATHPSIHLASNEKWQSTHINVGNIDSAFGLFRWYELALPAAIARQKSDLVFSITNYLPLRTLAVPTVLLVQHAGHFSRKFDKLYRLHLHRLDRVAAWRLKTQWVEHSVRKASEITVQTKALADAVAKKTGRNRNSIHVIPHGPGTVITASAEVPNLNGRTIRIGYISKWGVQKNFEVLFGATSDLIKRGRDIRVILTLAHQIAEDTRTLQQAEQAGIADKLDNAGEVDPGDLSKLYDSLDIFVFPSLVESFGFPLVEAMAKGLPIIAADTPSNREIAKDAALFFPPTDVQALVHILGQLIDDQDLRQAMSAAAVRRAQSFSWRHAAEKTINLFEMALNHGLN